MKSLTTTLMSCGQALGVVCALLVADCEPIPSRYPAQNVLHNRDPRATLPVSRPPPPAAADQFGPLNNLRRWALAPTREN